MPNMRQASGTGWAEKAVFIQRNISRAGGKVKVSVARGWSGMCGRSWQKQARVVTERTTRVFFCVCLACLHDAVSQSGLGNEYGHIVAGKGDIVTGHAAGGLAGALAPV